uniref:ATP synthase F0 subunit 8 n=1 Tax=Choucentrus sinensis TaxID=3038122 RepID=UPI00315D8929
MPQMSPMWWLTLTMMLNSILMMTMCMLYFNTTTKISLKNKNTMKKMFWKW